MELLTTAIVDAVTRGTIDQIRASAEKRDEDRQHDRALLSRQLEAGRLAVIALDDLGLRLLAGFRNPAIWTDYTARDAHVAATRHYLARNELRPALESAQGGIRAHIPPEGEKPHRSLRGVPDIAQKLNALDRDISRYLEMLATTGGGSGVFGAELAHLCDVALQGDVKTALVRINWAENGFDRQLSVRIVQASAELTQRLSLRR